MIHEAALNALGLGDDASPAEINEAITCKQAQLQQALNKAPTEALQNKYREQLAKLQALHSRLLPSQNRAASLSHTQLVDLPQSATQFDGGQSAQIKLQTGQLLANRYEIREQIGAGGMGAVYRALDANTGKEIALKVLLPGLLANERARERFLDEARISQQLSHPNIVNVFDVQRDGDFYFLTMELLEGQDLRQLMENRKLAHQQFSVEEVLDILASLCEALTYAHEYTVHRDIKPENIWLTENGKLKIMDFGIARVQSTSQRTQTGAAMGTAYYMAPEQLRGQKEIDGRADLYALAVMAYEMLSGEVPVGMVEPLHSHRKDIGKKIAQVIHQALSPKPESRFADVRAFQQALQKASDGRGPSLPQLPWKTLGIAVGALLVIFGIGGLAASGSFSFESLKNLLPVSKEDIAAQKAGLAKIQGEIKVLKQRLDNARRNLDSDVRDAERNKAENLAALQHWQRLTEDAIFAGSLLTELEGNLAMAETLLRDNAFVQSKPVFEQVRAGYDALLKEFETAARLENLTGELVAIPGGSFSMGSSSGDAEQKPVHRVSIKQFMLQRHEVTRGQFSTFVQAAGYITDAEKDSGNGCIIFNGDNWAWQPGSDWRSPGISQRDSHPVVCVTHDDAQAYAAWLSKQTGRKFRLLTEAEWEYAARANTSSQYSWGDNILCSKARFGRRSGGECSDSQDGTAQVGSFASNTFGLYDMHGNVWEWTQDCWNESYQGAPADGSAWASGDCKRRVLRGGSWFDSPVNVGSANRFSNTALYRSNIYGFRLAQDH